VLRPLYEHTQQGWLLRFGMVGGAAGFMAAAVVAPVPPAAVPQAAMVAIATIMMIAGWFWSSLTVRIEAGQLFVRFGLGWPRRTIALTDIRSVELTQTSWWSGLGLHRTARGWLYNVAGRDAVVVGLASGQSVLIGSDDARRLKSTLERAVAEVARRRA